MSDAYSCPACGGAAPVGTRWPMSGLAGSIFQHTAEFATCADCGHLFVGNIDDQALGRYYTQEAVYFAKAHFDVTAPANITKYQTYRAVLAEHGLSDHPLTDIGCGRGGFLQYLAAHGWGGRLMGVDVDAKSLALQEGSAGTVLFHNGSATALPFEDASQDVVSAFHVFEHFRDLDPLMSEVLRVLKPGGALLIEVPDAERYADHPYGIGYWMTIREHVQHFTAPALVRLLERFGLSVRMVRQSELPTPEFSYPSLMILAEKSALQTRWPSLPAVGVAGSEHALATMTAQAQKLDRAAERLGSLTFWGVSEEFFALIPLLSHTSLRFCDKSPLKQGLGYGGGVIEDPASVPCQGGLVITARIHAAAIRQAALALGWSDEVIFTLP